MGEVKLHGFWPSPFSCSIIWALKLKGVDHEYIEEDILSDKSELLLKYNPVYKMVPILVHNGKPIAESLIILEFIDETRPENPLLPEDPYERAQARFWVKFAVYKVGPLVSAFVRASGEGLEKAAKEIIEALKIVEDEVLGDKKFFGGDALNIMDITYGFFAHWFVAWEQLLNFKVIESHTLPRFHAWANIFKEVPAIKENLPDYDKLLAYIATRSGKFPKK